MLSTGAAAGLAAGSAGFSAFGKVDGIAAAAGAATAAAPAEPPEEPLLPDGVDTSDGQELVIEELDPELPVVGAAVVPVALGDVLEDLCRRFFLCVVPVVEEEVPGVALLLPVAGVAAVGAGAGDAAGAEPVLSWALMAPQNKHKTPASTPTRIE